MSHVLVTTDFSTCSTAAFAAASEIQKSLSATLTIASVVGNDPEEQLRATHGLEAIRRTYFECEPVQIALIPSGSTVALDVTDYAARNEIDLIVIASHGRSGLDRHGPGTVAQALLGAAKCPVLTVPYHGRSRTSAETELHIIATTDLSEESEVALPVARLFLTGYGPAHAKVTLVHVLESPPESRNASRAEKSSASPSESVCAKAEDRLEYLREKYFTGTAAATTVIRGNAAPHQQIIDYADTHDADVLIAARGRRSDVRTGSVGSVAEKLARLGLRRVVIVP